MARGRRKGEGKEEGRREESNNGGKGSILKAKVKGAAKLWMERGKEVNVGERGEGKVKRTAEGRVKGWTYCWREGWKKAGTIQRKIKKVRE